MPLISLCLVLEGLDHKNSGDSDISISGNLNITTDSQKGGHIISTYLKKITI